MALTTRQVPDKAQRRGPVNHVAVMVCTRGRPAELAACLASLANLKLPGDVRLSVCIGDNNDSANPAIAAEPAKTHGLNISYAHQPERGYASVRNSAIDLALQTDAGVLIFIDDDSTAAPDLVTAYLAAFETYPADTVVGRIGGISINAAEGEQMRKAGTGNVAIRRWIVDRQNGYGLRFDERLNLLGFEDFEFFREVVKAGGTIYRSTKALTITLLPPCTMGHHANETHGDLSDLKAFATMEGRNEIVATRLRHGLWRALARASSRHGTMALQGTLAYLYGVALTPVSAERGLSRRQMARLRLARAWGAFSGLGRPGFDRPLAKTGQLVEVPGTGLRPTRTRRQEMSSTPPAMRRTT